NGELGTERTKMKIPLLIGLAAALTAGQSVPPRKDIRAIPPDYLCLDTVVKASAPDRGVVFASLEVKRGECESAVMPSPLSEEDRNLLYNMSIDSSNVYGLY